jgi:hypothetical protein
VYAKPFKDVSFQQAHTSVRELFWGAWGARKGCYLKGQIVAHGLSSDLLCSVLWFMRRTPISGLGDKNVCGIIRQQLISRGFTTHDLKDIERGEPIMEWWKVERSTFKKIKEK